MPQNLLSIHGVSGLICAVGEGGRVLHWRGNDCYAPEEVLAPTKADLTGVWVESERSAWAVGSRGTVLRWDGENWREVRLVGRDRELHAVWGSGDGSVWVGGDGVLLRYRGDNGRAAESLRADAEVVSVWGSDPDDVFFLCAGRRVLHWNGLGCAEMELPGRACDEFYSVAGRTLDEAVWVGGVEGALYHCDGQDWSWHDSMTDDVISGMCCTGPEDLWVVTGGGQLRHWDGMFWNAAAFSPGGYLSSVCAVDGHIWAAGRGGTVIHHRPLGVR